MTGTLLENLNFVAGETTVTGVSSKILSDFLKWRVVMCGRYTLETSPRQIAEFFELLREPPWEPRNNICPTQQVLGIDLDRDGHRQSRLFQWGLIPSWAKDPRLGSKMINARGETVAEKPSFRAAFKRRRCLIPADGFYEWKAVPGQKKKQPYHIHFRDATLMAFAGLWEHWSSSDGSEVESCTIITTEANSQMAFLHDRMPVILEPGDYALWLDPDSRPDELKRLLHPLNFAELELVPRFP
ncbi:MAG: SOS response-associated peptidase [Planctomycetaceae bacterium]|nr:SOS response-associated peptidase [Planctomycetaceae bacterium]